MCWFERMMSPLQVLFLVFATVHAVQAGGATLDPSPEDHDYFEKHVRPILVERCFACHAGTKAGGGLSLQTAKGWQTGGESGPAIVPGKPEASLLIEAINYRSLEMPPADQGGKLSPEEIAVLTEWVARGAPDPRDGTDQLGGMSLEQAAGWWAFQPLPETDTTADPNEVAKQVDALIQQHFEPHHLEPTLPADRRTLLRRMSYGLTGLPPKPEETEAFEANTSIDAVETTIERLLQSPQYGVHWGRHWLDVVRYADTAGENTDRPLPHAWRYRNWVMNAFQQDMPFDQFVRWQIAGDILAKDMDADAHSQGIIATGYLAIARRFGHDIDKDMYLTYEDVIDNLGKNFLGLTLGCARCHDHKYDPITAADYYALYGIFDSTQFAFPGCEPKGQPRDLVPLLPQPQLDALMQSYRDKVAEVESENQQKLARAKGISDRLEPVWTPSRHNLVKAQVDEGASVPFEQRISVRRGEVVLLSVFPNGGHGADSTLVEWAIHDAASPNRTWSVKDVVSDLLRGNGWNGNKDGTWSFLEVTGSPTFLTDRRESNAGNDSLQSWSLGSEPSVFVNRSEQPQTVWTLLPASSFFVHPGPNRPVAVAWTSPLDGDIVLQGRVADAHPAAGLDGISFQLEHLAAPELGPMLAELGRASIGLSQQGSMAVVPQPSIPVAYAVVDRAGRNARLHERGDPEKLGDEVSRRWLSVFGAAPVRELSGSGRKELADWIARHPLMARVIVNRIWEWHFGQGLVRTSNDFGSRGEVPTHPELLDFLAAKFVQSGYRVQAIHRIILRTAAYQRSCSTADIDHDPENRWLARFQRRRLTAEELRDSLLQVSGQLDLTPSEAHPFPAEATWGYTQHAPFHAVYETNRRSVYLMVQRQRRHPFLALFDGADPNASTPTRQTTTVPTQALYFINDPFFHEQASKLAESILTLPNDSERLERVYRGILQRQPAPKEANRLQTFVAEYPGSQEEKWSALVRVLLASNEFLFVE